MVGGMHGQVLLEGRYSLILCDFPCSHASTRWLAMAASFGVQNAYGVFQDFYTEAHTASPSSISWIGSIQLFLFTSMGIISGKFVDKGYCRHTIFFGSLLFTFS